jgi:small subunit ribosomal protein S3Ae
MAYGKNKGMSKGGKKGAKKKAVDPFTRKEWYKVKAPSNFTKREIGHTLVNRTQGTKIASEGLKGRVFEVSHGDLGKSDEVFRKFRLICEDVQGKHCLTNFHGMDYTRDKLCSMVRKWQTLIEVNTPVKTTDGYTLRVFCIGFTKRNPQAKKKTAYAKHAKVRAIRAKMVEIVQKEFATAELKEVVNKLIHDSVSKDIEQACQGIYPLHEVHIRKVKCIRKPKFDLGKLMEMHGDMKSGGAGALSSTAAEGGDVIDKPDGFEPAVQQTV